MTSSPLVAAPVILLHWAPVAESGITPARTPPTDAQSDLPDPTRMMCAPVTKDKAGVSKGTECSSVMNLNDWPYIIA